MKIHVFFVKAEGVGFYDSFMESAAEAPGSSSKPDPEPGAILQAAESSKNLLFPGGSSPFSMPNLCQNTPVPLGLYAKKTLFFPKIWHRQRGQSLQTGRAIGRRRGKGSGSLHLEVLRACYDGGAIGLLNIYYDACVKYATLYEAIE
jgi:hypothetical protein